MILTRSNLIGIKESQSIRRTTYHHYYCKLALILICSLALVLIATTALISILTTKMAGNTFAVSNQNNTISSPSVDSNQI
jgi:hypothetical protein